MEHIIPISNYMNAQRLHIHRIAISNRTYMSYLVWYTESFQESTAISGCYAEWFRIINSWGGLYGILPVGRGITPPRSSCIKPTKLMTDFAAYATWTGRRVKTSRQDFSIYSETLLCSKSICRHVFQERQATLLGVHWNTGRHRIVVRCQRASLDLGRSR